MKKIRFVQSGKGMKKGLHLSGEKLLSRYLIFDKEYKYTTIILSPIDNESATSSPHSSDRKCVAYVGCWISINEQ